MTFLHERRMKAIIAAATSAAIIILGSAAVLLAQTPFQGKKIPGFRVRDWSIFDREVVQSTMIFVLDLCRLPHVKSNVHLLPRLSLAKLAEL